MLLDHIIMPIVTERDLLNQSMASLHSWMLEPVFLQLTASVRHDQPFKSPSALISML